MKRYLYIAALVIAGEMVYGLPFHTIRFFRPTVLEVFGFSNTQLGYVLGVYGVTAILSYFPGGALADRFPARTLLVISLLLTGLSGFYMATLPNIVMAGVVYGFWGISTIFLFWGALIRATRDWGGWSAQGRAFGVLEAGRGLASALFASLAVAVFALVLPDDGALVTDAQRQAGLQSVYIAYSLAAIAAAAFTWWALPAGDDASISRRNPFPNMLVVLRQPIVWAQAGVIICAYSCFRTSDYYAQYAVVALGMDEVDASRLASIGAYIRPVAALAAGIVADRFSASSSIAVAFALLVLTFGMLSLPGATAAAMPYVFANVGITLFAVFSLRGIYYALLQETRTPRHMTGAAVGLIAVVGYTPDFFYPLLSGMILDASPGAAGFRDLFLVMAGISMLGIGVVAWLVWLRSRQSAKYPAPDAGLN